MNEKNSGEIEPEGLEREPIQQTLKEIAKQLGFIETIELQEMERRAIDASQTLESIEDVAKFNNLIAQIQFLGEPIAEQEQPKTGFAQIGLMAVRAATLIESGQTEDCKNEIYDILTALDNMADEHTEVSPIIQKLEALYESLKE